MLHLFHLILSLKQVKLTVCGFSSTETSEGQRLRVPETGSQDTVWSGEFRVFLPLFSDGIPPAFSLCTSWEVSWNIYLKVINKSGWFGGKTVKCNTQHTYPEARIHLTRGTQFFMSVLGHPRSLIKGMLNVFFPFSPYVVHSYFIVCNDLYNIKLFDEFFMLINLLVLCTKIKINTNLHFVSVCSC